MTPNDLRPVITCIHCHAELVNAFIATDVGFCRFTCRRCCHNTVVDFRNFCIWCNTRLSPVNAVYTIKSTDLVCKCLTCAEEFLCNRIDWEVVDLLLAEDPTASRIHLLFSYSYNTEIDVLKIHSFLGRYLVVRDGKNDAVLAIDHRRRNGGY